MTPEVLATIMLASIIATGASQAAGAWLARPYYRVVNHLAREVLSAPEVTADDRRSLAGELGEATKRWPLWLLAALAPLWSLPLFVFSLFDAYRFRGVSDEEMDRQVEAEYLHLDRMLGTQHRPVHSAAFSDRREAISDAAFIGMVLTSPLLSIWLLFWASPSLLAFVAIGAADVAVRRFRLILETAATWLLSSPTRTA